MAAIQNMLSGFRLVDGGLVNQLIAAVNNLTGNGTAGTLVGNATTLSGILKVTPQFLTAAGATQGNATAITNLFAVVNVATTNSSKGVRLPVAATGLEVTVLNAASHGVKVYPATNGKIGAAATNAADATLLKNKTNTYLAVSSTLWVAQTGA